MKRNLTVLLMEICSIICCYAQVSIKRDYHKMDIWTQNPFVISNDMESNKSFNTLLGRYLHLSMTNESTDTLNKDSLSILFSRPSFKELVKFMLIKDREDLNIFYPESHETWDDYKINLLYNYSKSQVDLIHFCLIINHLLLNIKLFIEYLLKKRLNICEYDIFFIPLHPLSRTKVKWTAG